jgi:hypothetical protein
MFGGEVDEPRRLMFHEIVRDLREGSARPEWTRSYSSAGLLSAMSEEGVLSLWSSLLKSTDRDSLAPVLRTKIIEHRLLSIARAEALERGLNLAARTLNTAGIAWCAIKGAALSRQIYEFSHHRPMLDIDLLVAPSDFERAKGLLAATEVAVARDHGQRSHETNLEGEGFWIDLHQDLLGGGRSRTPWGTEIVQNRTPLGELWVPDELGTFAALTVHLAVTDYVSARLIRAVDLDRWLRRTSPDWEASVAAVRDAGLASAAWLSLSYVVSLFDSPLPEEVLSELAPSRLKSAYLSAWLRRDPAAFHRRHPQLTRGAFQLFLGDSVRDALRALRVLGRESLR